MKGAKSLYFGANNAVFVPVSFVHRRRRRYENSRCLRSLLTQYSPALSLIIPCAVLFISTEVSCMVIRSRNLACTC